MSQYGTNGHPIVEASDYVPVTYHVTLTPELARELERYVAGGEGVSNHPETIITEAVRAYLGVDG